MISRMVLTEEDDDGLDEEEMLATVFLMYLAGHVTTVNLVGNGVVALLTHPEQLAKLQADPSWPRTWSRRRCATGGRSTSSPAASPRRTWRSREPRSRAGEQVTVGLAAANRDPERFANPDAFDITREDANRHVAFGKGIHVCLGAPLARVEGQVAFETLIRRYPESAAGGPRRGDALGRQLPARVPRCRCCSKAAIGLARRLRHGLHRLLVDF